MIELDKKERKEKIYFNALCKVLLIIILIHSINVVLIDVPEEINRTFVTFEAFITSILCFLVIYTSTDLPRYGMCVCILIYTILTQFGAGIIYYLCRSLYGNTFSNYDNFLQSNMYGKSILLGCIAIISYVFAILLVKKIERNKNDKSYKDEHSIYNQKIKKGILYVGYALLIIVDVYFIWMLIIGKINLSMTYNEYMEKFSRTIGQFYAIILLLYAIGICFVFSVGNRRNIKIGIFLFLITGSIMFLTGNRGEVLYPMLACVGIVGYRRVKITWKQIIIVTLILGILISTVRQFRDLKSELSWNNVRDNALNSFTEPIIEMGMQLRLSVFILEEFDIGTRDYINGFSYYYAFAKVIGYAIPIDDKIEKPKDYNFEEAFPTMAFSQVAEAYANYGVLGIIIFYMILGIIMGKWESKKLSPIQLAFGGCFTDIMINATRNYFSMVPIMTIIVIIILLFIHIYIRTICKNKKFKEA